MKLQRSLCLLLIISLLLSCELPSISYGEEAVEHIQALQESEFAVSHDTGSTKATILQEQTDLQKHSQKQSGPADYSDEEIRQMTWDQLPVEDVVTLYHALDRDTLQIAATFYSNQQQLLSSDEITQMYEWTDEEVMKKIGQLPRDQFDFLEQHTAIARLYQQWEKSLEVAVPPKDPSTSTEGTIPADTLYRITESPYQYKIPTANPVDELYRSAQVKETDLSLQGKHGLDVLVQRHYSSMDSMVTSPEYTGHEENRSYAADDPVWHYNLPSYKRVMSGNIVCSYSATKQEYGCDYSSKAKYFLVLDDGTTLETDQFGSSVLRYPYSNVKLSNFNATVNKDYPAISADIDGLHYDFKTETVLLPKDNGEGLVQVVTKSNLYGDKITYRIPLTYDGNIEITDSVGRFIVLESGSYHTFNALKVYSNTNKDQLLAYTQYVWGNVSYSDVSRQYVLQEVIAHAVNGSGNDKSIAKYTYYDPNVHGNAEFNLYPYWIFSAPNQQIALDYQNQESSQYVNYDSNVLHRGVNQYLLLKQVEYPVEGAFINYSYSTYDSAKPMLQRGVVRLYQDDNALTYTSYLPVTSVSIRYKKTPNPYQPGNEGWYSAATTYPLTYSEI